MLLFNKRDRSPGRASSTLLQNVLFPVPFTTSRKVKCRHHPCLLEELLCPRHHPEDLGGSAGLECAFGCKAYNHKVRMQIFAHTAHNKGDREQKGESGRAEIKASSSILSKGQNFRKHAGLDQVSICIQDGLGQLQTLPSSGVPDVRLCHHLGSKASPCCYESGVVCNFRILEPIISSSLPSSPRPRPIISQQLPFLGKVADVLQVGCEV